MGSGWGGARPNSGGARPGSGPKPSTLVKLVERHRFDPRNALHRRLLAEEVLPSTAPEDLRELQGNYQRMGHDRTAATHWARQFAEAVRGRRSS